MLFVGALLLALSIAAIILKIVAGIREEGRPSTLKGTFLISNS